MSTMNGGRGIGQSNLPFCTACGTANSTDSTQCVSCGAPTVRASQAVEDTRTQPLPVLRGTANRSSRPARPAIIALSLAAMAVAVVGVGLLMSRPGAGVPSPTATPTGSPPSGLRTDDAAVGPSASGTTLPSIDGTYTGTLYGNACDYELTLTLREESDGRVKAAVVQTCEADDKRGTEYMEGMRLNDYTIKLTGGSWSDDSHEPWKSTLDKVTISFDSSDVSGGELQSFDGNWECLYACARGSREFKGNRQQY